MKNFVILACLCIATKTFGAFGYYSPVSINSGQVPSTQTDFPVLVSFTDARFKTAVNGGHVQSSIGADIRPYTDGPPTTAITGYELERYNGSTGEVVMWVKVGSLTSSSTPIYLAYGDPSLTTDGSSTTTWSSSFVAVYHLPDGTTLGSLDSSGNAHTLANNSATATTGQIDGAGGFVAASTQELANASGNNPGAAFTLSAWIKATSFPAAYNAIIGFGPTTTFALFVKSNGKLACYLQATAQVSYDGTGSNTLSTATWYYLTMTYSSTDGLRGYVNGSQDGTGAANGTSTSHTAIKVAGDPVTASRNWNGAIDEPRTASVVRTANWITTEYNEGFPGTFETLGTEVTIGPVISPNRVKNFFFSD